MDARRILDVGVKLGLGTGIYVYMHVRDLLCFLDTQQFSFGEHHIALDSVAMLLIKMYCIVTDVSGGYSSSILDAIRKSIEVSKALSFSKPEGYRPISHHEALYMATLGGAQGNEPNS